MSGHHQPRGVRADGIVGLNGWRLKRYLVSLDDVPIDDSIMFAVEAALTERLPAVPAAEHGIGFLVVHQGELAVWVLANLWTGDIMSQHTLSAPLSDSTAFVDVPAGGPTACVFEIPIHAHEAQALIRHVLDPASGPDVDGYLGDVGPVDKLSMPQPQPSTSRAPTSRSVARSLMWAVRPIRSNEFEAWTRLYRGYAAFYETATSDEHQRQIWSWIHNDSSIIALVAVPVDNTGTEVGEPQALAHLREWVQPLRGVTAGYLDDLFVDPDHRGSGAVDALYDGMHDLAIASDWATLRWTTADDNYRARAVYDRRGTRTTWITYDLIPVHEARS